MSRHTHISTHIPQASMCTHTHTQTHHLPMRHTAPCTHGNITCQSNLVFLCIHPSVPVSPLSPTPTSHLHNLRKLYIANTNSFPWPEALDYPALPTPQTTSPSTSHLPIVRHFSSKNMQHSLHFRSPALLLPLPEMFLLRVLLR